MNWIASYYYTNCILFFYLDGILILMLLEHEYGYILLLFNRLLSFLFPSINNDYYWEILILEIFLELELKLFYKFVLN
jgi:hypothetical protein